ncbi:MAG: cytochrome b [Pseudomonadota bacterium]
MPRYAPLQRIFHWLMALIILPLAAGGVLIGILGFQGVTDLLGGPLRDTLYEYHKTFGLIVLGLIVARLFLRMELGHPAYDPPLPLWQRLASSLVHYLLYLALFAMPILGWLATDASDYPVEFFHWNLPQFIAKDEAMGKALYATHGTVGWILVALIALHVGAALKHWLIDKDGVAWRMNPF